MRWRPRPLSRRRPPSVAVQVEELLDVYHDRVAVTAPKQTLVDLTKLSETIRSFLERIEMDPETPFALYDIVPRDVLKTVFLSGMGSVVLLNVAQVSAEILRHRYPEHVVSRPIPAEFHLSGDMPVSARSFDLARRLVNECCACASTEPPATATSEYNIEELAGALLAVVSLFTVKVMAARLALS